MVWSLVVLGDSGKGLRGIIYPLQLVGLKGLLNRYISDLP